MYTCRRRCDAKAIAGNQALGRPAKPYGAHPKQALLSSRLPCQHSQRQHGGQKGLLCRASKKPSQGDSRDAGVQAAYLEFGKLLGENPEQVQKGMQESGLNFIEDEASREYLEEWEEEEAQTYKVFETLLASRGAADSQAITAATSRPNRKLVKAKSTLGVSPADLEEIRRWSTGQVSQNDDNSRRSQVLMKNKGASAWTDLNDLIEQAPPLSTRSRRKSFLDTKEDVPLPQLRRPGGGGSQAAPLGNNIPKSSPLIVQRPVRPGQEVELWADVPRSQSVAKPPPAPAPQLSTEEREMYQQALERRKIAESPAYDAFEAAMAAGKPQLFDDGLPIPESRGRPKAQRIQLQPEIPQQDTTASEPQEQFAQTVPQRPPTKLKQPPRKLPDSAAPDAAPVPTLQAKRKTRPERSERSEPSQDSLVDAPYPDKEQNAAIAPQQQESQRQVLNPGPIHTATSATAASPATASEAPVELHEPREHLQQGPRVAQSEVSVRHVAQSGASVTPPIRRVERKPHAEAAAAKSSTAGDGVGADSQLLGKASDASSPSRKLPQEEGSSETEEGQMGSQPMQASETRHTQQMTGARSQETVVGAPAGQEKPVYGTRDLTVGQATQQRPSDQLDTDAEATFNAPGGAVHSPTDAGDAAELNAGGKTSRTLKLRSPPPRNRAEPDTSRSPVAKSAASTRQEEWKETQQVARRLLAIDARFMVQVTGCNSGGLLVKTLLGQESSLNSFSGFVPMRMINIDEANLATVDLRNAMKTFDSTSSDATLSSKQIRDRRVAALGRFRGTTMQVQVIDVKDDSIILSNRDFAEPANKNIRHRDLLMKTIWSNKADIIEVTVHRIKEFGVLVKFDVEVELDGQPLVQTISGLVLETSHIKQQILSVDDGTFPQEFEPGSKLKARVEALKIKDKVVRVYLALVPPIYNDHDQSLDGLLSKEATLGSDKNTEGDLLAADLRLTLGDLTEALELGSLLKRAAGVSEVRLGRRLRSRAASPALQVLLGSKTILTEGGLRVYEIIIRCGTDVQVLEVTAAVESKGVKTCVAEAVAEMGRQSKARST